MSFLLVFLIYWHYMVKRIVSICSKYFCFYYFWFEGKGNVGVLDKKERGY